MDMNLWPPNFESDVRNFLAADRTLPGQDLYEAVFSSAMFPLQRKRELHKMMQLARTLDPQVVLECGSDKLGSLYHWVHCLPTVRKAVAIEIRGCPCSHDFERRFPRVEFLWLEGSSYDPAVVRQVREFLGDDQFDAVFLDGDKGQFYRDFELYRPLIRSGGLALLHDVNGEPPQRAFNRIAAEGYETSVILDTSEADEAAQRESEGRPIDSSYEYWLRFWKHRSCGVGVVRIP